jgi:UDP-N-acetylglucosamine 1-carboxyvinyltransferase
MVLSTPNGLTGTEIDLQGKHGPTVLGTDNVMMAATLAKGTTIINSAACEPEVVDLANFLISMGAKISGAGTRRIIIEGVEKLHGTTWNVIPDRIEAGTFMIAGAMAAGPEGITLNRINREHIAVITEKIEEAGHICNFSNNDTSVTVIPGEAPQGCEITTNPFPQFPTDMQAQFTAMFATTPGISLVVDTIYPQRFMHCSEMKRMGADIDVDNGRAVIKGVKKLSAAPVMASDLRASAALVLAGLTADGSTHISRLYHIDRGYEHIDEKLLQLGAKVERVSE